MTASDAAHAAGGEPGGGIRSESSGQREARTGGEPGGGDPTGGEPGGGDRTEPERRGRMTVDELRERIRAGAIDTVITAITDMQGRLMGKRVTGDFFLDHGHHGMHFCTYLLGTDMEMTTPPGYRLMNWDTGYGDWVADPDWSTLRELPWHEKTALVLCDVRDEDGGAPVDIAPRALLRRQVERARALGFEPLMASELEFYLLRESYEAAAARHFHDLEPFGWYNEDYHLLQATKAEPIYRLFRNLLSAAGVPIEFSKGEAAAGQHEVNIRYAPALEAADRHTLFKHGVKEIGWQQGHAVTFMAKPDHAWTGNSAHIHVSLLDADGKRSVFHDAARGARAMSATMRHFLGGLMHVTRELAFFYAPFVNSYKRYASASWAPVNIVWARDNRTCGYRVVGSDAALRIENRFPGGDTNPYLAYAMMLGAGLYGIEHELEPPAEYQGNAYTAEGVPRVPGALWEAIGLLERSELARSIFGDDVIAHYLNAARVEQQAYDMVVTCWERERYLERG